MGKEVAADGIAKSYIIRFNRWTSQKNLDVLQSSNKIYPHHVMNYNALKAINKNFFFFFFLQNIHLIFLWSTKVIFIIPSIRKMIAYWAKTIYSFKTSVFPRKWISQTFYLI